MINRAQMAIVKKDLKSIVSNKRLFPVLVVVPLMLTVVVPTIFMLTVNFAPEEEMGDFRQMLAMLPFEVGEGEMMAALVGMIINYVMPVFFMMVPIMVASVMAASSFVGEKEKRTLETLFYCPLSLRQIFVAKVLAAFILSMLVSLISFLAMWVAVELEAVILMGGFVAPDISWLVVMLLVAPAVSLLAITLIVRGSVKARTMEESQQKSAFLILPLILVMVGQFGGVILVSGWVLLGIGVVVAVLDFWLLKRALRGVQYERVLE